ARRAAREAASVEAAGTCPAPFFPPAKERGVPRRTAPRRIPAAGHDAERLVTHLLQDALVRGRHAAEDRQLHAVFAILLEEAKAVRAGETGVDRIDVGLDLRDVRAVVGHVERRPELLHHLAARVFENALEPR